jgi:hypothetical protein
MGTVLPVRNWLEVRACDSQWQLVVFALPLRFIKELRPFARSVRHEQSSTCASSSHRTRRPLNRIAIWFLADAPWLYLYVRSGVFLGTK